MVSLSVLNIYQFFVSFRSSNEKCITVQRIFLHLHLSLNRGSRWGTTDEFTTSFLHFSLFSTVLWDLPNSRPVHSLTLSSHLFLCLPCLLPPCKMVLARPDERESKGYFRSGFFQCQTPLARSSLPAHTYNTVTLSAFKYHLKPFLFKKKSFLSPSTFQLIMLDFFGVGLCNCYLFCFTSLTVCTLVCL